MYNNPYYSVYNSQANIDRINSQIAELERMKQQLPQNSMMQPTNLTQNFQLAPTGRDAIRYANSLDEVQLNNVISDTPFFSKDMSIVWIKTGKGEVKTYELNEIIPKDEKDLQIEYLQAQIEELKGMMKDVSNATNVDTKQSTTDTTEYDEPNGEEFKETKSTGISKVSRSKKEQ